MPRIEAPWRWCPPSSCSRIRGFPRACMRIHSETSSNSSESRNGTRHPHALNASSPMAVRVPMTTSSAANKPRVAVVWIQLVYRPRFPGRSVLRDVGGGATILTAEREPLQQAQDDECHRRRHSGGGVARQQADQEGRAAHDAHGDEKRMLRPTRSPRRPNTSAPNGRHGEPGGECRQCEDETGDLVDSGKELRGDDARQQSIEIEVVPLEDGAERRCTDDQPLVRTLPVARAQLGGGIVLMRSPSTFSFRSFSARAAAPR